ncbi:MAG: hypothetical protein M3X11_25750, partial [Acidobacteriota bacterium]|nr:hypothetical protein [Acidobacteriota bacterium]
HRIEQQQRQQQHERQHRIEQQRRNGVYGQVDRNRDGIDDRYETRNGRIDVNRNGVPDRVENNRGYGRNDGYNDGYYGNGGNRNDGYYGNGGYGNGSYGGYGNTAEMQKGYRDGLDRGQEDLRARRRADPNNSSHFRKGSGEYRDGFRRGYIAGYNQSGYNRGW